MNKSGDTVQRPIIDNAITIKEFDACKDSVAELTALLHRAYKKLGDMGLHFWATTQSDEETLLRIEGGTCYVALRGGEFIGTICFYPSTEKDDSNWYNREDVGRFGQFAVDPECQKMGIGRMLLATVEKEAVKTGKKYLALDTSDQALHLIDYYKNLGFVHAEYIQWERVNYRSTVMIRAL